MITRNPAGALAHYEALAARGSLPIAARGPAWRLFMRVVPPDDPEAWRVTVTAQRDALACRADGIGDARAVPRTRAEETS